MKLLLIAGLLGFTVLAHAADVTMQNPHGSAPYGSSASVDVGDVKVSKAVGQNAYTVAEVIDKASSLKDKQVVVHGKVVKFSGGIMDKNWVHLRDGSGTVADKNNDLVVTTKDVTKVGAVVTVKGTLRTDKDFGYGYNYAVLVEDATLENK